MYQRAIDHGERVAAPVSGAAARLPMASGIGAMLRDRLMERAGRAANHIVAASSLIPNDPVLNIRDFGWTGELRARWQDIRAEALALAIPATADERCAYPLWDAGNMVAANAANCPVTSAILAQIPGIYRAGFNPLAGGSLTPVYPGGAKALVSCHLGLCVPRDGDVRMRLGNRVVRWADGETLVFDGSYAHQLWNDAANARLLLTLQFRRPLREPGRWVADQMFARGWWR